MNAHDTSERRSIIAAIAPGLLWCAWQAVRLPLLALLIVLEPVVRIALCGFALVGTVSAFVFEFAPPLPHVPFWGMLSVSLGCIGVLALYHSLMRALSGYSGGP